MESISKGSVLWLTGLSGSGKTTIAQKVFEQLTHHSFKPVMLDGDEVRAAINDPHWGFDNKSRLHGSYRYAKLAALLANQGHVVIVPTISMFKEVREWNRINSNGYYEVYIRASELVRIERDPKKLYLMSKQGVNESMAGVDLSVELPCSPDLIIDNNGDISTLNQIVEKLMQKYLKYLDSSFTQR